MARDQIGKGTRTWCACLPDRLLPPISTLAENLSAGGIGSGQPGREGLEVFVTPRLCRRRKAPH